MKKVIAALALVLAAPALAENHDVGIAGEDCEILIPNVEIRVIEDTTSVAKHCGAGTHGCAILGRLTLEDGSKGAACNVYVKSRRDFDDTTVNHEMKHCYGWVHEEMPKRIRRSRYQVQADWLEKNHAKWEPLPAKTLELLNSSK